jgi:tripartite-type tricarboxylate transporter receptor subunit TctC
VRRRSAIVAMMAAFTAVCALMVTGNSAFAADYPVKPITIVVPSPAGGVIDVIMRLVADKMTGKLNQPIIIDNKPGANGYIGGMQVKASPADGYTLLALADSYTIGPFVQKNFDIDFAQDMQPIGLICEIQSHLFAGNTSFKTMADFITYAKAHPGELNFGSTILSLTFTFATILKELNVDIATVQYEGSSPAIQAILSGDVDVMVTGLTGSTKQLVEAGDMVVLGSIGPKRSRVTPDLPTIVEFAPGFPGLVTSFGLVGPKGMPVEIAELLNKTLNEVLADPAVSEVVVGKFGNDIALGVTPEQFRTRLVEAATRYRQAAELLNFKPQ